jgi:hypothetical protein
MANRQVRRETANQKQLKKELLIQLMAPKIPKVLRHNAPFPPSMEKNLQFSWEGVLQGASPFLIKEFELNSAFSPDLVGTPSGFAEMAAIYNFYKVISAKFYYRVYGNETGLPVRFCCILRDTQPSTIITTYALANDAAEVAPSTKIDIVGQTNGMNIFESQEFKIDCGSLVGQRLEYLASDSYRGLVTAQPAQIVWLAFLLMSISSATNLTNGAIVQIFLTLRTNFYSNKVTYG